MVWRASRLVNMWRFGGVAHQEGAWKLHAPSHIRGPMYLFHLAIPELYTFIINH